MKRIVILLITVAILATVADAASVRRRYVPASPAHWGQAPELVVAEPVKPRQVEFIHYGGVIEIGSDFEIDRVEVYSVNGQKLRVKRVRGNSVTLNPGDFDYGIYIVLTRFTDGAAPAVNKFISK